VRVVMMFAEYTRTHARRGRKGNMLNAPAQMSFCCRGVVAARGKRLPQSAWLVPRVCECYGGEMPRHHGTQCMRQGRQW